MPILSLRMVALCSARNRVFSVLNFNANKVCSRLRPFASGKRAIMLEEKPWDCAIKL